MDSSMRGWTFLTVAARPGRALVTMLVCIWLTAGAALAQTRGGFAVQGTVLDWKNSPVAGAIVRLESPGRNYEVKTGTDGAFTFPAIVPGKYHGRVVAEGFPAFDRDLDLFAPPRAPLTVKLQVLVAERIEVRPLQEGNRNLSSMTLTGKDLESLGAGDFYQRLRELAGATGKPANIPIIVDGFRAGLRLPPREAIEMVRINANSFAAEFADLTDGRIEITTKPGVDDTHGQFQFAFNDDALNARDAFAPSKPPVQMRNFTGYAGGPIIRNRWGYLAYAGRWAQDANQVINATIVERPSLIVAPFNVNFETPERASNLFVQTSYLAGAAHSLSASYSRTEERARNQGLASGRGLPEYGFDRHQTDDSTRFAVISTFGPRTLNELRIEWSRRQPESQAVTQGPAVMVLDAFNGGGNQDAFFRRDATDAVRVTNHLTRAHLNHTYKVGAELNGELIKSLDRSGWGGTFIFGSDVERDSTGAPIVDAGGRTLSIAPVEAYRRTVAGLPGYGPSQFSIVTGNPSVDLSQWELATFAQDDWRPTSRLTLSYGLRSEAQTNLRRGLNVAPRFGAVWAPEGKSESTVRGGIGVFYNRVDTSLTLDALRLDGQHQREIVIPRPEFFAVLPDRFQEAASSISSVRVKAGNLGVGRTISSSLSYERQLPGSIFGSVEYRWQRADGLLRSRRLAAPAVGGTPVFQYESTGRAVRHDLVAGMRTYFRGLPIYLNYTLASTRNDTDGSRTLPADSADLSGEFGWAGSDQRHNVVISGTVKLPLDISLSPFITLGSGRPFNITTGRDNNGDTVFTDRPSFAAAGSTDAVQMRTGAWLNPNPQPGDRIIPRNFGRGAGEVNVSLYAFRIIKLNKSARPAPSTQPADAATPAPAAARERREYAVSLSASAENLINRTNLTGYNGVLVSSAFGQPIRALGPRRVQLTAGFSF